MTWTRLADQSKKVGVALFLIAIGSIGNSIIVQAAKINWWHSRSNELAAIGTPTAAKVDKPASVIIANTAPVATRCPVVGKKGDVIVHVVR